jgi:hypothetical protein
VDAHRGLVWFVAKREIAVGEELHYEYRRQWWTRSVLASIWGRLRERVLPAQLPVRR